MPSVQLGEVAVEDAESYRDAVIAREPGRLSELSGWIQATGGPWDELDASLESLGPLWTWFMGFVADGCPGIPVGTTVQGWIAGEGEWPPPLVRIGYGLEAIGHYVMLVCRRIDPAAIWSMDRHQPSTTFQKTGIELSNGDWRSTEISLGHLASETFGHSDPTAALPSVRDDLRLLITRWLGDLAPAAQERRTPILPPPRPSPDPPLVLWRPTHPAPTRPDPTPPVIRARTAEDSRFENLLDTWDGLHILRGPGADIDTDNLSLLDPLDADLITAHLREHGLTVAESNDKDGRHVQYWDLEGDVVSVSACVVSLDDGAPRYVGATFEGDRDFRAPDFQAAATIFITLAQRLDARLTNSDDIYAEQDDEDDDYPDLVQGRPKAPGRPELWAGAGPTLRLSLGAIGGLWAIWIISWDVQHDRFGQRLGFQALMILLATYNLTTGYRLWRRPKPTLPR
jgi:hypothetical protein